MIVTVRFAVSTRWERIVAETGGSNDCHDYFCCCAARRVGNMFVFCQKRDGTPVVVAGPCWPFCFLVTLPLILGACGSVSYFFIISERSPLVRSFKKIKSDQERKSTRKTTHSFDIFLLD